MFLPGVQSALSGFPPKTCGNDNYCRSSIFETASGNLVCERELSPAVLPLLWCLARYHEKDQCTHLSIPSPLHASNRTEGLTTTRVERPLSWVGKRAVRGEQKGVCSYRLIVHLMKDLPRHDTRQLLKTNRQEPKAPQREYSHLLFSRNTTSSRSLRPGVSAF
jgi:hypothetical protein